MKTVIAAFSCLMVYAVAAQDAEAVVAEGRVFNAETKEPVVARITYQSLPYGSRMGIINQSTFSFTLFDNERYSITVEAPGFASAKYMLDPAEANGDKKIIKDIELHQAAGSAGSKYAEGRVLVLNNLIFEVAKSKIDPDSYAELDMLAGVMLEHKTMMIQLEGHTDYLGDPAKNMKLSEQRVEAVRNYLVSKGVKKSRIRLKAFGGTMPISRDNTPEGHRLNRRVEVRILKA